MVVPKNQKLKIKNKIRYSTGAVLILISISNYFFHFYSPVASIIIWPLGLGMMVSAIQWPKVSGK